MCWGKTRPQGDYRPSPSPGKNYSEEEFTDFLHRQKSFLVKREEKINSAIEVRENWRIPSCRLRCVRSGSMGESDAVRLC